MMKFLKKIYMQWFTMLLLCTHTVAQAERGPSGPSLGDMANIAMEPVGVFTKLMFALCYIIGASLVVGALIQYKEYRNNPIQVPLNRPIILLVLGLALIAVPLIVRLSQSHFPS